MLLREHIRVIRLVYNREQYMCCGFVRRSNKIDPIFSFVPYLMQQFPSVHAASTESNFNCWPYINSISCYNRYNFINSCSLYLFDFIDLSVRVLTLQIHPPFHPLKACTFVRASATTFINTLSIFYSHQNSDVVYEHCFLIRTKFYIESIHFSIALHNRLCWLT